VRHCCRGDHSSRRRVTTPLKRPTRTFGEPSRLAELRCANALQLIRPYLVLLRVGFAMQRSLLNARCALTAPFHPYLGPPGKGNPKAVSSLWHFPSDGLEAATPGRYPAHRSVEFGLSSPCSALSGRNRRKPRGRRSPNPNAIESDYTAGLPGEPQCVSCALRSN
jgi:hypothetical protein